jgi:hypothetical protein
LTEQPENDVFSISFSQMDQAQVLLYALEGKGIKFNSAVPSEIARRLGLRYHAQEKASTEVCYLDSPELRSEFKMSFNIKDLSDWLNAELQRANNQKLVDEVLYTEVVFIPYPTDVDEFWKMVEAGEALRLGDIS